MHFPSTHTVLSGKEQILNTHSFLYALRDTQEDIPFWEPNCIHVPLKLNLNLICCRYQYHILTKHLQTITMNYIISVFNLNENIISVSRHTMRIVNHKVIYHPISSCQSLITRTQSYRIEKIYIVCLTLNSISF